MQLDNEKLLPVVAAIETATGVKVHLSTALRWCQFGADGILLESVVLGSRRMTSVEAVRRFTKACTAQSAEVQP